MLYEAQLYSNMRREKNYLIEEDDLIGLIRQLVNDELDMDRIKEMLFLGFLMRDTTILCWNKISKGGVYYEKI